MTGAHGKIAQSSTPPSFAAIVLPDHSSSVYDIASQEWSNSQLTTPSWKRVRDLPSEMLQFPSPESVRRMPSGDSALFSVRNISCCAAEEHFSTTTGHRQELSKVESPHHRREYIMSLLPVQYMHRSCPTSCSGSPAAALAWMHEHSTKVHCCLHQ